MNHTLTDLRDRLRRAQRTLDQQAGEARAIATTGRTLKTETADLRRQITLYDQAAGILARIADNRQATTQTHIETLVSQGLRTIFGDDLSFHLTPGIRNKTPVIDFVVRSIGPDGTIVDTDVMDARGGGLAATIGFLLRLVVLLLSTDRENAVLFLDETFAHVSAEYEPRLAEFLRELVDKTGIQIIMVTHSDAFSELADVRYRFDLINGTTHATAL